MKYLTLATVFLLAGAVCAVVLGGDPTQKVTPQQVTQKTAPLAQKTEPLAGPTQKYSAQQKGGQAGMWVYLDADLLARIRQLEADQETPILRSVAIACAKKIIGSRLEELVPDLPLPPGPSPGPGLLGRRAARRANAVDVRAPLVRVQVPAPEYAAAIPPPDTQLPAPPEIR